MTPTPAEEWLPIPGYSTYEASSQGRIRTLKGRLLNPYLDEHSGGYRKIKLYLDGKRRTFTVARLVALAFLGPPFVEPGDASHLNDNHTDDRIENLAWEPRSTNQRRAWRYGRRKRRTE